MKQRLGRAAACLTLLAVLAGILPAPALAAGFQDVPAGHWAAESIQRCVSLGFFQGKSSDRFGVGENMTRAAFAVVLSRFFDWEVPTPEDSVFTDVSADAWYAGAVQAAYEHGAITDQRSEFRPDDALTREELAVMLVRALGYGTIAGLAQDLPLPFQDVTTNVGYITMAYDLGLMDGTSATAFSPGKTATREQVAVILMRLYDKLHSGEPEIIAVVEEETDLSGLSVAAIPAARLMGVGAKASVAATMTEEAAAGLRDSAREAGAQALLYVAGGPSALSADVNEAAELLVQAVKNGGYDGLFLYIPQVSSTGEKGMTRLVQALNSELGELTLYVAAEAPTWGGKQYEGYDYEALAQAADRLVLRIASYENQSDAFPTAPVNPLEEVYYALAFLRGTVDSAKLTLMLDTQPSAWTTSGRSYELPAEEFAALLETGEQYYSSRYACPYVTGKSQTGETLAVWYLDRQAVRERTQMASAFGVGELCVPQWDSTIQALTADK